MFSQAAECGAFSGFDFGSAVKVRRAAAVVGFRVRPSVTSTFWLDS